ncbi:Tyrosine aminotransferase [Blattella germanica]|nr:Tyrosine aminotransferase [Blattella germanica]
MAPSGVRREWAVAVSSIARNTHNPIRNIVENLRLEPNPDKPMIALSIGDPTVFGNLRPPVEVLDAVHDSLSSLKYNGYAASTVLADPGKNILVPRPGFSVYRTLAEGLGIRVKSYNLRPDCDWEVDLDHLEAQMDENTAALIVNNPSNPCGSVYSRQHLQDILNVARKQFVPIIADEIYEHMVFPGQTFHSLASISKDVPILSCSGLTKRFLVPGWRMGWITIHDRNEVFEKAEQHAKIAFDILSRVKGLTPVMPKGAMYMMVGINMAHFPEFCSELHLVEQMCFDYPNYIRLVLTVPEEQLTEACHRISDFCERHYCNISSLELNPGALPHEAEKVTSYSTTVRCLM